MGNRRPRSAVRWTIGVLLAAVAVAGASSGQLTVRVRLPDGSVRRVQADPEDTVEECLDRLDCDAANGVATDAAMEDTIEASSTLREVSVGHGSWLYLLQSQKAAKSNAQASVERMMRMRERQLKGGGVREVSTLAELEQEIKAAKNSLVVIDFHATWCGPCKQIAPAFKAMADDFTKATFLKVDVDRNKAAAQKYSVSSMPTFKLIKGGSVVDSMAGADEATLRSKIRANL